MLRYILKRVFSALITIFFVITITFFLMKAIPGDPFTAEKMPNPEIRAAMMAKYGLDQPLMTQYITYLKNFVQGDFGVSYMKVGLTVNQVISSGFPFSLYIGIYASIIVVVCGICGGVICALRQNKFIDRLFMVLSTLGATIPSFVLATGFLFIFSKTLGLVPAFGVDKATGYIGPIVVIGAFSLAFVTRLTRTSILEVMQQDYIRTARSNGISEFKVIYKHALRNALLPVITYIGPMVASIVTGSFVIEKVFGIPGIGNLFTNSTSNPARFGQIKINGGPVICKSSFSNPVINRALEKAAEKLGIAVQYEICGGITGTDADKVNQTDAGVPSTVVSIPLRYMHSPSEVGSLRDLDQTVEVLAEFLAALDESFTPDPFAE